MHARGGCGITRRAGRGPPPATTCLVSKLTVGRVKCRVGQGGMTLWARGFGGVLVGRGAGGWSGRQAQR
jgi:hypothetical protein